MADVILSIPDSKDAEGRLKTTSEDGQEQTPSATVHSETLEGAKVFDGSASELEAEQALDSDGVPLESSSDPNVIAEIQRFQRMEACLYKHRKEWEVNIGPGNWNLKHDYFPGDPRLRARFLDIGEQTWETSFANIKQERAYQRPDVFDPANIRDERGDALNGNVGEDAYDMTINWGSRRDRLRRNFEWEMDRMFLREEIQLKKKEQQTIEEGKKRRERRMAEGDARFGEDKKGNASEEQKGDAALPDFPGSTEFTIAWSEWNTFRNLLQPDMKSVSIINVLIGDPVVDDEVGTRRSWFRSSDRRVKKSGIASTGQHSKHSLDPATSPIPERVRIRSDPLLRTIAELLGSEGRPLLELQELNAVFIRPYKALTYREEHLRGWCKVLQRKFEGVPSRNELPMSTEDLEARAPTQSGTDKENQSTKVEGHETTNEANASLRADIVAVGDQAAKQLRNMEDADAPALETDSEDGEDQKDDIEDSNGLPKSITALRHLRCLLEFFDTSVAAKRSYLNSPQCRKIFYSDLWQLFRPGTEVVGADGKQAYRVIGVKSAKHRIAPPWERWYKPTPGASNNSDFSITCVYLDFDGSQIGPVKKVFNIGRFDGQREVTSLEVYPLRFHPIRPSDFSDEEWQEMESYPVPERYRRRLIHRGARFLAVVKGKHMYYAGSTLEEKEQVESPVVIDFETAITTRDAQCKPPMRPFNPRGPIPYETEPELLPEDRPWKPKLSTFIGIPEELPPAGDDTCSGECCQEDFVYDDQYVDQKQTQEYIESLLPDKDALDEQPPITIMPRPWKDLKLGPGGDLACSDDELVIMSYRVFGFVLRSRKFAKLDLAYLTEVHTAEESTVKETVLGERVEEKNRPEPKEAFDRLVLEEGHSSMIVSLIAQHFRDKKSTTGKREEFDIVRGKGKGLIILLHGAPGVGKTSTAEGVAEKFKKPLFQITCGDLGTTASEVELALEKNFTLANKWDCILLLDEADVFLTERSKEDFKRNGLVAVFLRLMEYYSGILFLTTNRVGDFDEAFTSRIHVSLYYPALNEEKTGQVFEINMDMIEERFKTKGRAIEIDRMKIAFFALRYFNDHPDARWNGRQIRNACQTALALAEFEAQGNSLQDTEDRNLVVKLNVKHFEIVRNAYLEFNKYMQDLYGTSNSRRAKESKLRAIWVDENDNIVLTQNQGGTRMDKKAVFTLASQNLPNHVTGHSPHQSFQQATGSQYGRFQQPSSTFGTPQPQYQATQYQPPQHQHQYQGSQYPPQQQAPSNQDWQAQQSRNSGAYIPEPQQEGQFQGSVPRTQQASPAPNRQQQAQSNPAWLTENIRSMHAASGQPGDEQTSAGASGPRGW